MKKKLYLSFLWHMHQPYYKDDIDDTIHMPWVFLHAIKDYHEMLWHIDRFTKIKATFNLVPSLLVQLKEYEDFHVQDRLLSLLRKDVDFLELEEKKHLLKYLFFAHEENQVKPLTRYHELCSKKYGKSEEEIIDLFSNDEVLELEVLFLLSWCGNYLRENNNVVKALLVKERDYNREDKILLLQTLSEFIKTIVPYYKEMEEKGKISISATPFYHPIGPLLLDLKNAKDANSYATIPNKYETFEKEAELQIEQAVDYFEKEFEKKPRGFWPAEGSVNYDFLEMLAENGVKWACSDEEILHKTLHTNGHGCLDNCIYKNTKLNFKDQSIHMFFRDKTLSDLIGFNYSGWNEEDAVGDFIGRLKNIYDSCENSQNVNVILDGENAWEFYKNNAYDFFDTLYRRIEELEWCECTTFDEVIEKKDVQEIELYNIATGSWIYGDFTIWIGHHEKNRGWELLSLAKKDFEKNRVNLSEKIIKKIENEFLIALGSDWFWWYGDDHFTALKGEFDYLFRKHLMNVYTLMHQDTPESIMTPIVSNKDQQKIHIPPHNDISVEINGYDDNYFEWMGAGEFDLKHEFSAMDSKNLPIEKLKYGYDENYCYFSLYGDVNNLLENSFLEIMMDDEILKLKLSKEIQRYGDIQICLGNIIELKILKSKITDKEINFKLFKNNKLVQLIPTYSKIKLNFQDDYKNNWFI